MSGTFYLYIVYLLLVFPSVLFSTEGIINVGKGSYTTILPEGAELPSNNKGNAVTPAVTSNFTGPAETNDWWSSAIWKRYAGNPYSEILYPHPMAVKAKENGLGIGYPDKCVISADGTRYEYVYKEDIAIGVEDLSAPTTEVECFSDWTVTLKWSDEDKILNATCGHGLPFIYFTLNGGAATVSFLGNHIVWYNENGVIGVSINNHHYGLFAPTGSSWEVNGLLKSTLGEKKYISIALLPDSSASTITFFKKHAYAFVEDSRVTWTYEADDCLLKTEYSLVAKIKEGPEVEPLISLYPHQWKHMSVPFTNYSYVSSRGTMKVLERSSFETTMRFHGVIPALPNAGTYDKTILSEYLETVVSDSTLLRGAKDTYWTGKELGKAAALVRIADQNADTTFRNRLLHLIKTKLEDWFTASPDENNNLFYYNPDWNTMIGYTASYGSDTELNDHHFHYGYFIMAAATVAQYDREWSSLKNWGGMVDLLIRDVANMDIADDSKFPKLRCFDSYAGHCWASGHGAFAAGNNQESSSESINFSTAVILWGSITENRSIRDLGIFLYVNEVEAVRQYWFDQDREVFPSGYNHTTLGILWGNGGAYATWWTDNPEELHGINWLPFNGGSLYLGYNPGYSNLNYTEMVTNNNGLEEEWKDIVWQFMALFDPADAINRFDQDPEYSPEDGSSKAHTYHWIHNLNILGRVDTTIYADIPTYACFLKDSMRTYTAYNPSSSQVTVTFSDNVKMELSSNELNIKSLRASVRRKPANIQHDRPLHSIFYIANVSNLSEITRFWQIDDFKFIDMYTLSGKRVQRISKLNGKNQNVQCVLRDKLIKGVFILQVTR